MWRLAHTVTIIYDNKFLWWWWLWEILYFNIYFISLLRKIKKKWNYEFWSFLKSEETPKFYDKCGVKMLLYLEFQVQKYIELNNNKIEFNNKIIILIFFFITIKVIIITNGLFFTPPRCGQQFFSFFYYYISISEINNQYSKFNINSSKQSIYIVWILNRFFMLDVYIFSNLNNSHRKKCSYQKIIFEHKIMLMFM